MPPHAYETFGKAGRKINKLELDIPSLKIDFVIEYLSARKR